jgi:hypothetical protein
MSKPVSTVVPPMRTSNFRWPAAVAQSSTILSVTW